MRAAKSELTEDIAPAGLSVRGADWGEMHVTWETHRDSHDLTPVFKGLPDDLCSTPHWGYVIRGGSAMTPAMDQHHPRCHACPGGTASR
jgi:hypothetical protein